VINVIETIKRLILDYQETRGDTGTARLIKVEKVTGKATVIIGVRRGGKSTYLFQIIEELLRRGIARENILYLNFFDDRLHTLWQGGLSQIVDAYYSLYPDKKNREKVYCFFDEIQAVSGWEPFIDRLMRTEKCEVYLTGSSAEMLSKEVATQMRGRAVAWELFPFSMREFLDYHSVELHKPLTTAKTHKIHQMFDLYWENGGFPEVAGLDQKLRVKIHQDYFQTILYRDLVERHNIAHPKALSDLAHWLVDNTAALYSINRLTAYLKSLGHNTPKNAVAEYIQWFEDAYFLFSVFIFDPSSARRNTNPKRVYCIDHALVVSVSSGILVNSGHLLENLVFITIRRLYQEIYYYKTRTGKEVDFIVLRQKNPPLLIQVCESLVQPHTKQREVVALTEAMAERGSKVGYIITRYEEENLNTAAGIVKVLPAWRFLLDIEEL
jgi:uncharacterized protein